ncbi:FAD binding domain-containing protein [Actinomadura scrupuli]|uniref:FAD binding domain-containing protein n=1 Tax=Actinomadura scrupuli TaxID=559629 RepID=UPI003D952001
MTSVTAIAESGAVVLRAGGTDLMALHGLGRSTGPYTDLRGVPELRGITWGADGSAAIGAMTTVAELAADQRLAAAFPVLTAAAAVLATPQIRAAATLGGNLLQRNRCWYFRNPLFSCHQTGGDGCPARSGAHPFAVVIDQSPCIAPHPSSLAVALLAHEAGVRVHGRGSLPVGDLYGDDPGRDHLLEPREVLLGIDLPAPRPGERAAHQRTGYGRAQGDWPQAEVAVRLVLEDTTIVFAAVAAGGIARTPLRLTEVEEALVGRPATAETIEAAAARAAGRCTPLPHTIRKVAVLEGTLLEALERSLRGESGQP